MMVMINGKQIQTRSLEQPSQNLQVGLRLKVMVLIQVLSNIIPTVKQIRKIDFINIKRLSALTGSINL